MRILLCILIALGLFNLTNLKLSAASYSFASDILNLKKNCVEDLKVFIDANGQNVNAADVRILYNPNEIEIVDADTSTPSLDLVNGNAFNKIYAIQNDTNAGYIQFAGDSSGLTFNDKRQFATVKIKNIGSTTSTNLSFWFTGYGDTIDSNIADASTSMDILDTISNVTLNFNASPCTTLDNTPPGIFLFNPNTSSLPISNNSTVTIKLVDDISGIDTATITISINGTTYDLSNPAFNLSGTPNNYLLSIDLAQLNIQLGSVLTLYISANDLSNNASNNTFSFNIISSEPDNTNNTTQIPPKIFSDLSNFVSQLPKNISNFLSNLSVEDIGNLGLFTSILGLLFTILSGLNLFGLLANMFGLFISRKRRSWGVITDINTGKPISLANCRLFLIRSVELVASTVSGLDGTYGFPINTGGEYRLEITKSNYKSFFKDLIIPNDSEAYTLDVNLAPIDSFYLSTLSFGERLSLYTRGLFTMLRNLFFLIGGTFSLIAIIIFPNIINILVLALYIFSILIWLLYVLSIRGKSSKIIDSESGRPIPHAIVKIYDLRNNKYIDTIVAGPDGSFDYFGTPGEYGLLVLAKNYIFPSKLHQHDGSLVEGMYSSMIKVNLKKGRNKLKLFMDKKPEYSNFEYKVDSATNNYNLSNPFS